MQQEDVDLGAKQMESQILAVFSSLANGLAAGNFHSLRIKNCRITRRPHCDNWKKVPPTVPGTQ